MAKRFTLTALLSALALVLISSLAWAGTTFMTMGTGSPGGVYYPLGGGMSVVIQKTVDGVRCAAESTGASVENSRLVGVGDTDMGMVMGSVGYNAFKGNDPFEKEYPLVALFQMYPAPEHIVTTKDSDIKTIQDLKGKKVSIDVPGSGCSTMAKAMLTEA
ncbi:MAG: TAXI family TRAP transporter solute-binding subunit, partial [Thermodesulfobacteriota bacterium]